MIRGMLPQGFTSRSATIDDADAIYRLMAAGEIRWHGQAEVVPDRVAADLRRPALDLSRDTLVVEAADGDIAGWAWIHLGKRAQIDVHPSYQGLGIGTALLDWAEGRSREEGREWLAQTVDDADKAGTDLVRSRGYEVLATNWLLERTITAPQPRILPPGIWLSPYDEARAHEVHELIEAAFAEFQQRPKSFDEWARLTVERPTFRPNASTLAYAGDELVGAVIAFDLPATDEGTSSSSPSARISGARAWRGRCSTTPAPSSTGWVGGTASSGPIPAPAPSGCTNASACGSGAVRRFIAARTELRL
jgi:GNAT superfamily N-acetyltransferase